MSFLENMSEQKVRNLDLIGGAIPLFSSSSVLLVVRYLRR